MATTLALQRQWAAATAGLPAACPDGLRLSARTGGVVAAVPGSGLFATTDGTTWAAQGGTDEGTAPLPALVQDPDEPLRFWVAGEGGVFRTDDGGVSFTELGVLPDVRSLSVHRSDPVTTILAVAGTTQSKLLRLDGSTWTDVTPAGVGTIGHPLVLDDEHWILGTDTGVWRTTDGGTTPWTKVFTGGVVGLRCAVEWADLLVDDRGQRHPERQ